MLIVVGSNMIFFGITMYNIIKTQAETKAVVDSNGNSKSNYDKHRFFLYLRLFVIMGGKKPYYR